MKSKKILTAIILIVLTILVSFSIPKTKYSGTGFISELKIPSTIAGWTGKDVTKDVGLNINEDKYNFVSGAVAYQYVNKDGKTLLLIILDAGNFHHPKVCFTSAGFKLKELPDTVFDIPNSTLKTHSLFTERGRDNYLSFYWIVIDKDVAHEWIEQKAKQLFFSLFGKKRVGLMVRVDIPTKETDISDSMLMAKKFIYDLSQSLDTEQVDYIFGNSDNTD
ncbi:MAG: exosortase C-terminal domain/associated protein EpsI [Nitrospirota bacterium]